MLTSASRTAARRVFNTAIVTNLPYRPATHIAPLRRLAPVARSFSASAWVRFPAASPPNAKTTKKKTAIKKATKKKAPKKKAAPKKKKPAKKVLTPEEKEKADLRELRKKALLKGPSLLPETAWAVYVSENVPKGAGTLSEKIKTLSSDFKAVSEFEKSRLANVGHSNKEANKEIRRDWVKSHPVEAIYVANVARRSLGRKLRKNRVYLIHDDRLPKRAGTAYTLFIQSRFSQLDRGSAKDTFKAASEEWRSLSDSEKSTFQDQASREAAESKERLKSLREKGKAYWKEQDAKAKASKTKA